MAGHGPLIADEMLYQPGPIAVMRWRGSLMRYANDVISWY